MAASAKTLERRVVIGGIFSVPGFRELAVEVSAEMAWRPSRQGMEAVGTPRYRRGEWFALWEAGSTKGLPDFSDAQQMRPYTSPASYTDY
jgi:hypothetical protein